jgi:mono/diheme cytochrome c family protein
MWIVAIMIWPVALCFTETLDASSTPGTASEVRGRGVFIREGCASCHGTEDRRGVGPDLSRESGVRPADWHFTHLFSPRAVTPRSVMPSYTRLFDGAPDRPTQEGRDLVAYLDALGRARDLGAPAADAVAVHPATLNPARARRTGAVPPLGAGDRAPGMRLFADHCAGCHGATGEGDGPGAAGLRPKPANLAAHRYSDQQIAAALWNGVAGTAMPAWRDQPLNRIAMLIAAAQSFGEDVGRSALRGRQDVGGSSAGLEEQAGLPTNNREMGARVYATHCVQCHGERGGGDGFSALSLAVAPANFQRQQPSLDYALRVIAGGVEGTPMAPWTSRMSEQELLAVAHYVRSFYKGGAR